MDDKALTTIVRPQEDGLMIKEIIYGRLQLSRGLLRRMKRGGGVYRNGKKDYLTRRVQAGDQLRIVFFDEKTSLEPECISLDIVYEDDYLLVVNKPTGMAVHPSGAYQSGTLGNALAYYWQTIGLKGKIRLVHRIDRDTSGLILVAKDPYTLQGLIKQLRQGELVREYLALVEGCPKPARGLIAAPIGRSLDHGVKRKVVAGGKEARTWYEVLAPGERASLVQLRLESGRTHQIRVHLAAQGHPLLGDPLYNKMEPDPKGQALHSWRLRFRHPRLEKDCRISTPMPETMGELWKRIGKGDKETDA